MLEGRFPGLIERLYLASCEECVDDIISYASELPDPYDSEKEHVLVALKLNIAGRPGILLLDPGYHIGRAVTVMQDCCYPHTGEIQGDAECRIYYVFGFKHSLKPTKHYPTKFEDLCLLNLEPTRYIKIILLRFKPQADRR